MIRKSHRLFSFRTKKSPVLCSRYPWKEHDNFVTAHWRKKRALSRKSPSATDGRTLRARSKRAARRAEVLNAALAVFAKKGYHGTSISDIIDRAGIARGTFYLYFRNKRAIFEELLSSFLGRIGEAVHRVTLEEGAPPPDVQIRDNVTRVFDVLLTEADFTRLLLRQAMGQDPEFDKYLSAFYDRILDLIQGALELGQQLGLVRPCNTRIAASCLLGSIKEVTAQILRRPEDWQDKRDLLVDEVLRFALQGLFLSSGDAHSSMETWSQPR